MNEVSFEKWEKIEGKNVPATSSFSKKLFDHIEADKVVLDLGCGYGRLCNILKEKNCKAYGIDINKSAIKEAQKNKELKDVNFSVQNAKNLNFEDSFFDVIISQAVLACMAPDERRRVMDEIFRVLKANGILHISEFGQTDNSARYMEHKKTTKEYGTVIVKNKDGTERFRTHNFSKKEMEDLIESHNSSILHYENPDFTTINGESHPGHIFIIQKEKNLPNTDLARREN